MQATVKYLTNGYSVIGVGEPETPPQQYYAADLSEVVYFIATIFGLVFNYTQVQTSPQPWSAAVKNPMMSQEAIVFPLSGGGFITRAQPNLKYGTPVVEEYCADMDGVHAAVTKIYTYVPDAAA